MTPDSPPSASSEMARSYGRIMVTIWNDDSFTSLPEAAQRLYFVLLSQPDLSACGVLPLRIKVWSRTASDSEPCATEQNLRTLAAHSLVMLDDETDEVWLRTFMRDDGVFAQPNMMKAAGRTFGMVFSEPIRKGILDGIPEPLREGFPDGSADGFSLPNPLSLSPEPLTLSPKPSPPAAAQTALVPEMADRFVEFWNAYPRKVDKKRAQKRWTTALKDGADAQTILDGLARFLPAWSQDEERFIPHAATWLNGERWNDEPPSPSRNKRFVSPSMDVLARAVERNG